MNKKNQQWGLTSESTQKLFTFSRFSSYFMKKSLLLKLDKATEQKNKNLEQSLISNSLYLVLIFLGKFCLNQLHL